MRPLLYLALFCACAASFAAAPPAKVPAEWLKLIVYRGGLKHEMTFKHGDPVAPLAITGPAPKRDDGEVRCAKSLRPIGFSRRGL